MQITPISSRCLRLIGTGMFAGLLLSGVPQTAFAQSCVQDLYGKNLQCTANDVRIAAALSPVVDPKTGAAILSCNAGDRFSFVATFKVVTTATARENIGMYFAKDGQASALTGGAAGPNQLSCADNVITPIHDDPLFPTNTNPGAPRLGTSQYEELDTSTPKDTCGDISTSDNNQLINVYVENALCKAGANGQVALPNCTSWQQPGGTNLCSYTAPPAEGYPFGTNGALPGSPSKCNCDNTFTIPVTVQQPGLTVAKTCTVGSKATSNTACAFDGTSGTNLEGGTVTYGLSVTNTSNIGDVIVDEVCDSAYGGLYSSSGTFSHCTKSTTVSSNTCGTMSTPWTIDGTPSTCGFAATVGELANVSDIITVYGHGASAPNTAVTQASNSISVTSGENPSTATITAGVTSPTANTTFCTDVTYNVGASNTSTTDESPVTLTSLTESAASLGDLTKVSSTVLATSCSVPQAL
ncbi:MAG TPA: hypothetical protein VJU82_18325, partial [Acidobacteriaceae bacterium]|nr:hypothetical protein [Acidobacteriaceae bacterium]